MSMDLQARLGRTLPMISGATNASSGMSQSSVKQTSLSDSLASMAKRTCGSTPHTTQLSEQGMSTGSKPPATVRSCLVSRGSDSGRSAAQRLAHLLEKVGALHSVTRACSWQATSAHTVHTALTPPAAHNVKSGSNFPIAKRLTP